jgi:hypothetical protein
LFLHRINLSEYLFWGGFYTSEKANLDPKLIADKIQLYFYQSKEIYPISEIMTSYLEKTVLLSIQNNIRLILVNTPVHESYYSQIPPHYLNSYNKIVSSISTKHPEVIFLNLINKKYDQHLYGDGDHLNKLGADIFSKTINNRINH